MAEVVLERVGKVSPHGEPGEISEVGKKSLRFAVSQYRDMAFAVAYLAGFAAYFVLSVIALIELRRVTQQTAGGISDYGLMLIGLIATAVASGGILSAFYFILLLRYSELI